MNMCREEIFQFISSVFATLIEVDAIRESDELIEDLGISSMDILTLISYLEEEFDIRITERMIRRVVTVGDLVDLVQKALK
jgi:acyl carrier protein